MAIVNNTYEKEEYDSNGLIVKREVTSNSTNIHKNEEGLYIKIYSAGLDSIPDDLSLAAFRFLIQFATYASYADINDLEGGMLIQLNSTIREEIQEKLNIKRRTFYENLKKLVDYDLIREIRKSCYQLNPNLLGKGYFEYNTTYKQGGIKDLRENWNGNLKQERVDISYSKQTIDMVKAHIEELDEQIKHERDRDIRISLQNDKQFCLKTLKNYSETEYTKLVDYAIQQNKEIAEMPEQPEPPEHPEPPEGFGYTEDDPFGLFEENA